MKEKNRKNEKDDTENNDFSGSNDLRRNDKRSTTTAVTMTKHQLQQIRRKTKVT